MLIQQKTHQWTFSPFILLILLAGSVPMFTFGYIFLESALTHDETGWVADFPHISPLNYTAVSLTSILIPATALISYIAATWKRLNL